MAVTLENPWIGIDATKAAAWAALTPADQRWLGNADPTDPFILNRAPNGGQTADNAAQANQIATSARDSGPGVQSAGDIVAMAGAAIDRVTQNPGSAIADTARSITGISSNAVVVNPIPPIQEPIYVSKLPPATFGTPGDTAPAQTQGGESSTSGSLDYLFQQAAKTVEQSFIYKATKIVSRFSKGMFTQELSGAIVTFEEALAKAAAARAAAEARANAGLQTDPGEVPGVTVSDRNQTDPGFIGDTTRNNGVYDDAIMRVARTQSTGSNTSLNPADIVGSGPAGAVAAQYLGGSASSGTVPTAGSTKSYSSVLPAQNSPATSNSQVVDEASRWVGGAAGAVPAEYLGTQNIAREE